MCRIGVAENQQLQSNGEVKPESERFSEELNKWFRMTD